MPNYLYKCTECEFAQTLALPISFDPSQKMMCSGCNGTTMTRRIGAPKFCIKGESLGSWYKKSTGKEFLGK